MAIMKPKVRGFVCVTTHPEGCATNVEEQINYIKSQPDIKNGPKNILVIGSSTGYGLSSRIAGAFGCQAATLGVFFERPGTTDKPGSPGWYNSIAFERKAHNDGLYAKSINGDAFSHEIKNQVIETIKNEMGPIDLVVYSLASPRKTDPDTGETYKSVLKPIGHTFHGKTLDTDKKIITEVTIEPASQEEIDATIKVMGGEDWELWMKALNEADLLAPGVKTVAYSYIGPEVTWDIYKNGTIGKAKENLEEAARNITKLLTPLKGNAYVSVNKALVTQASSAIPVVPLYISLLYKIMKEKGTHEGCIEQMYRLFAQRLYNGSQLQLDEEGRIRIDDWEMDPKVQAKIKELWPTVTTESLDQLTDFKGYQKEFLKLFGFEIEGIDYDKEVELDVQFSETH
ncbi:MAG: bifunctional NADH-specific enoyl-ACP reductase/trans-2-enoyl-CoA reductase [Verrucomicrobia bacterium]|nr:MAG: bifunctional NADH-specific enoyl-ACP reductase/trans-2-enoyl-CoA reductase [Verrucomicrobiota bacterium]